MEGTIVIKCISCEGDIELPTQDKRCNHCDTPLKKSKKAAYKIFKACSKEMRSVKVSSNKQALAIRDRAAKDAKGIIKEATAELKVLAAKGAPNSEFLKVNQVSEVKIKKVFDTANRQVRELGEATQTELIEIAKKAGYDAPRHEIQESVQKISSDELKRVGSPYKLKWLTSMISILIVGIGIGITQTYLFLGVVAVIAGLLMLPLTHEVVSKFFTWLSYTNMQLMGYSLLTGVMLRIAMLN